MADLFDALAPPTVPEALRMPPEPIVRSADIEGPYRWLMHRAWGARRTIMWVLFNPSNADDKRDDPTTLRMMGFSYRWGFGNMIVANVYPFIASKPHDLHNWRRTFDHESKVYEDAGMPPWEVGICRNSWAAFHHNQRLISRAMTDEMTIVAAWGHGPTDADLDNFLHGVGFDVDTSDTDGMGIIRIEPTWYCLGKNLDGSPVHPLARGTHRVADDATLMLWKRRSPEVERYG